MLLIVLMALTSPVIAGNVKKQIKTMNKAFKEHTFTALNRLVSKSKYHISANGDTWNEWSAEKGQDKIPFLTVNESVAFNEGDTANQVWITQKSSKIIMVRMFCCGNRKRSIRTTAHVDLFIHSDTEFVADQATQHMIVTAISGFFNVEGFNDNAAMVVLNNPNDDLKGVDDSNSDQQSGGKDTVNTLKVSAMPQTVTHGESSLLSMTFNIGTQNETAVTVAESRTLSYQGKVLPGYPVIKLNQRHAGEYSTQLSQKILKKAAKGTYKYKGEVCVIEDCISKQIDLIVE